MDSLINGMYVTEIQISSPVLTKLFQFSGKLKKTLKGHSCAISVMIGVETKKGHFLWSGDEAGNIIVWKV